MKNSFLKSISYIYPQGVDTKSQWRDLIRVYSMGWSDALVSTNQRVAVKEWLEECKPLADLNWWPDETWKWW